MGIGILGAAQLIQKIIQKFNLQGMNIRLVEKTFHGEVIQLVFRIRQVGHCGSEPVGNKVG